jgi:nucleoside-diphosphate-sugar epimerase
VPAISKAKELLGWRPRFDLEEGLQQTIDWYRQAGHAA